MTTKKPMLLLLPNLLGDHKYHQTFLPESVEKAVQSIDGLIAESEKGGRRFLSRFDLKLPPHRIPLALLNKNSDYEELDFLLEPILEKKERWGVISDCGLPCMADPGAALVMQARKRGVALQAFVGPSSVTHALMLSGLPAQRFSFHGYPPKEGGQLEEWVRKLEQTSKKEKATQLFIEAPHRNQQTLERIVETLHEETYLCVAADLTMPTQKVVSQKVKLWKRNALPNIKKIPAIFLVAATTSLR